MQEILNFKDTPGLGNVVKSSKVFCKLTKEMPSVTTNYIMGDFKNPRIHGLAGHKFSRLCGFTFVSTVNTTSPTFQIVYVPKLRATLSRNDRALSGWYCWEVLDDINRRVISIGDVKKMYQFDVTAFFHCDMFEKYLPLFKSNVTYVLQHQIKTLVDATKNPKDLTELKFYVNAIATSINEIQNVQKYVIFDDKNSKMQTTSDNPHAVANLAYNANKSYNLNDIDKNSPNAPQKKSAEQKKSTQTTSKVKFDQNIVSKQSKRPRLSDDKIFDKYDDYDNDDYR